MLVEEDWAEAVFVGDGFAQLVEAGAEVKIEAIVTGVSPVMVMNAALPVYSLVGHIDGVADDIPLDKRVRCVGYSKLKQGDEWSGYEGYKICAKRAARGFADEVLDPVAEIIHDCANRIIDEQAMIDDMFEAFYRGNFSDLDLLGEEE
jgi:hypothetical protein